MALTIFRYSFPQSQDTWKSIVENYGNEPICQNRMADFGPTGPNDKKGSTSGSGRTKPKRTFQFVCGPKLPS